MKPKATTDLGRISGVKLPTAPNSQKQERLIPVFHKLLHSALANRCFVSNFAVPSYLPCMVPQLSHHTATWGHHKIR